MSLSEAKLSAFERAALAGALALLALFLVYPLAFSLAKGVALVPAALKNPSYATGLANSLKIAFASSTGCLLIGLPAAWIFHSYRFPGKNILQALLFLPLALPPFVGAVGMKFLFAQFGSVNLALLDWGLIEKPIDWFGKGGFWGVVVLETLHLFPILFLNAMAALGLQDPSVEEAARSLGARGLRLMRSVTLPLMAPGLFAGLSVTFVWAFTDLGTPLMFDYRNTATVQIFNMTREIHENPMGYALLAIVLALAAALYLGMKALLGRTNFEGAGPGRSDPTPRDPGAAGLCGIYLFLFSVAALSALPHFGVLLVSLADQWSVTVWPESLTTGNFSAVFSHELTARSVRNSLGLSLAAGLADTALGFAVAWLLVRRRFFGRSFLDALAMLPLAVPGLTLAFGCLGAFADTPLDPFINPFPLLIASYAVRRLPLMVRALAAGLQQLGSGLEEASFSLGAGPLETWRRVTLPLLRGGFLGGGLLVFAFSMLEVSDSLILAMEERFYPVTKAIYSLSLRYGDGPYVASALGVLGMALLMACFFLASRVMGKRMGEMFRF